MQPNTPQNQPNQSPKQPAYLAQDAPVVTAMYEQTIRTINGFRKKDHSGRTPGYVARSVAEDVTHDACEALAAMGIYDCSATPYRGQSHLNMPTDRYSLPTKVMWWHIQDVLTRARRKSMRIAAKYDAANEYLSPNLAFRLEEPLPLWIASKPQKTDYRYVFLWRIVNLASLDELTGQKVFLPYVESWLTLPEPLRGKGRIVRCIECHPQPLRLLEDAPINVSEKEPSRDTIIEVSERTEDGQP